MVLALVFVLGLMSTVTSEAQTITDPAKLEAFVEAAIQANKVIDRWQPQIDAAISEARVEQLREQANSEIEAVIAATENMTLDEYRAIYHAAQIDAVLAAMITDLLKKRMGQ
jgi:uncharacterized membrane protein